MRTHVIATLSVLAVATALSSHRPASADPAPLYPLAGIAYQRPEVDPVADVGAFIAFASTAGASHVERVAFIPLDHLTADNANFRKIYIFDADASGSATGAPLFIGSTTTLTSGGSGNWTAGAPAFAVTLSHDLPAGHSLVAMWESAGAGVALSGGAWRVE